MADTIRQKILGNIKSTLNGITVAAGYVNTVEAQDWAQEGNNLKQAATTPIIVINAGPEDPIDQPGFVTKSTLTVVLDVYAISPDNTDAKLNSILGDIQKALATTYKRGGYAESTKIQSVVPFESIEGQPYVGLVITIEILYFYKTTDPTSQ